MEVLEASDGLSGLEQARSDPPDVILLDVMMPGLDGWQVAEQLLEDERTGSIPIVFLTARAEVRDRARGLDLGGIDYVSKPFNPLELAPLVRELVERVDRGERAQVRRERISELRELIEPALAAGEVGRDHQRGAAVESSAQSSDADAPEARAKQVRPMRRAREPDVDDRAGARVAARAPRDVLADPRRPDPDSSNPGGVGPVREASACAASRASGPAPSAGGARRRAAARARAPPGLRS